MKNMGDKQPFESGYIRFWFTDRLAPGDGLTSLEELVVTDLSTGAVVTDDLTDPAKIIVQSKSIDVWRMGGTHGKAYKYTVRAGTAAGERLELDGLQLVIDR